MIEKTEIFVTLEKDKNAFANYGRYPLLLLNKKIVQSMLYLDRIQELRRPKRPTLQKDVALRRRLLRNLQHQKDHNSRHPLLHPPSPPPLDHRSSSCLLLPQETKTRHEQINQDAGIDRSGALLRPDGGQMIKIEAIIIRFMNINISLFWVA